MSKGVRVPSNEILAFLRHGRLGWEGDLAGVEHDVLPQNALLGESLPEGPLPIQQLEVNHCSRPHVHLHRQFFMSQAINCPQECIFMGVRQARQVVSGLPR